MRSTIILAALAASCVSAYEKRVVVTDWSEVIVTKTVTAPAVTETLPPVQKQQVVYETETEDVANGAANGAAIPTEHTDLAKKSTVVPEATTAPAPAPPAETSWWSTASTWEVTSTAQPAPSTLATSTATAPAQPSATGANSYQQAVLYNHNIHRSNHSAPSVDWDNSLEQSAHVLAARCVYEHDTSINGGNYGQNIGYGTSAEDVGVMITNMMYNDEIGFFPEPYGEASPSMSDFDKWGHFSQIVWKSTTHVGCATVTCNNLGNVDSSEPVPFTVCNYSPVGNVATEYGANVLKPNGAATYTA